MKRKTFDFSGYATKNDLLCADGRIIRRDAFKDDDGRTVPLVYQHNHEDPTRVIGHALLENRSDGVYAYCSLNNTDIAQHVKECVRHRDINALSIFANKLTQNGRDVLHGNIRELSVVLTGANPGAVIEFPLLAHGEESETEAFIWNGETELTMGPGMSLRHSRKDDDEEEEEDLDEEDEAEDEADEDEEDSDEEESEEEPTGKKKKKLPPFLEAKRKELKEKADKHREELSHADDDAEEDEDGESEDGDETVQDVLDTLNPKQKTVMDYCLDQVMAGNKFDKLDPSSLPEGIDGKTMAGILKSFDAKQKQVFEFLLGQAAESADGEISHAEEEDEEEESEDGDETIQDVLDTMDDDQNEAMDYCIDQVMAGNKFDKPGSADFKSSSGKPLGDILKSYNAKQKKVFEFLLGQAAESADGGEAEDEEASHYDDEGEDFTMKKNVFDNSYNEEYSDTLTHAEVETIFNDAKRDGSLRKAVLEHAGDYGIDQIDYLFPDYANIENTPGFIQRDMGWVGKVMSGVKKTPFSRVKTMFADITADQARAKGYITKNQKKTEVFTLLKRTTDPQTIYKYQKLDRDDILDITGFDVVAWMKHEMRMMLDEEIARAVLVGDGRDPDAEDHISQSHVRSIMADDELYAIHKEVVQVQGEDRAKTIIKTLRRSWKDYQGTGNCTAFMREDILSDLMLLEDGIGHFLYPTKEVVASVLGVKDIITVPVMADASTYRTDTKTHLSYAPLLIAVNLVDYNIGADKGGSVNMFEDFELKFNTNEYLIETRCSGALIRPKSAIVLEESYTPEDEDDDSGNGGDNG